MTRTMPTFMKNLRTQEHPRAAEENGTSTARKRASGIEAQSSVWIRALFSSKKMRRISITHYVSLSAPEGQFRLLSAAASTLTDSNSGSARSSGRFMPQRFVHG